MQWKFTSFLPYHQFRLSESVSGAKLIKVQKVLPSLLGKDNVKTGTILENIHEVVIFLSCIDDNYEKEDNRDGMNIPL